MYVWVRQGMARVQELCVSGGRLKGLASDTCVFFDATNHSALILNDVNVEATLTLTSSHGVCVSVEGAY